MRKSAMLALVVLHVACARGGADLGVGDNDEMVTPAEADDAGASGGESTGTTSNGIVPPPPVGGTSGGSSTGASTGEANGTNSGTSTGASTGAGTGDTTGATTGTTGSSTGGTSTGGTSTGGTSTGGTTGGTTGASTGATTGASTGGTTGAECTGGTLTCEQASVLGAIDGSDETSQLTKQGTGSAWFSIEVSDGNLNNMGNSRIGVRATLTTTSGTYQVTLVGDTSPNGAGRCTKADVTDKTPLSKSAIWGSYGPIVSKTRALTFHVQHLSGACDGPWTLSIVGNPCPALSVGFGEASLGSCP